MTSILFGNILHHGGPHLSLKSEGTVVNPNGKFVHECGSTLFQKEGGHLLKQLRADLVKLAVPTQ
jgi:hypothetical protein